MIKVTAEELRKVLIGDTHDKESVGKPTGEQGTDQSDGAEKCPPRWTERKMKK